MWIFLLDTTMFILVATMTCLLWACRTFLPNNQQLLYVLMKDHAYFVDYHSHVAQCTAMGSTVRKCINFHSSMEQVYMCIFEILYVNCAALYF